MSTLQHPFLRRASIHLFLFVSGMLICLLYGRVGMNPLDNSIVFDGAWRLVDGQHFFDDFITPNGFTPIVMQRFFFGLFGVNWFAYCFHAAVMNGLFCILVYHVLRRLGSSEPWALFYGLLSSLFFYAPIGTPYMDQHAFFFVLLAIFLCLPDEKITARNRFLQWMLIPPVLLLAWMSKQNPTVFALPAVLILLLAHFRRDQLKPLLLSLSAGLLIAFLLVLFVFPFLLRPTDEMNYYFFELPGIVASERMQEWNLPLLNRVRSIMLTPFQVFAKNNTINSFGFYFPLLVILAEVVRVKLFRKSPLIKPGLWKIMLPGVLLMFITSFFSRLTFNQASNGIPFIPLCLGIMHLCWMELIRGNQVPKLSQEKIKNGLLIAVSAVVVVNTLYDTWHFNQKVNEKREVADINKNYPSVWQWPKGTSGMNFLLYAGYEHYDQLNLDSIGIFIDQHPGNFLVWGDLSILYGWKGRPSLMPSLWLHPGLSAPAVGSHEWKVWEQKLLKNLQVNNVRYIIFDTWTHLTYKLVGLDDLPSVQKWVAERVTEKVDAGHFAIWMLK